MYFRGKLNDKKIIFLSVILILTVLIVPLVYADETSLFSAFSTEEWEEAVDETYSDNVLIEDDSVKIEVGETSATYVTEKVQLLPNTEFDFVQYEGGLDYPDSDDIEVEIEIFEDGDVVETFEFEIDSGEGGIETEDIDFDTESPEELRITVEFEVSNYENMAYLGYIDVFGEGGTCKSELDHVLVEKDGYEGEFTEEYPGFNVTTPDLCDDDAKTVWEFPEADDYGLICDPADPEGLYDVTVYLEVEWWDHTYRDVNQTFEDFYYCDEYSNIYPEQCNPDDGYPRCVVQGERTKVDCIDVTGEGDYYQTMYDCPYPEVCVGEDGNAECVTDFVEATIEVTGPHNTGDRIIAYLTAN